VASDLTVTASIASYSASLLESVTLDSDASGTNHTVTVTPVAGADGVGVVTLRVSDGDYTVTTSFVVAILPTTHTVLNEHFDYPLNTSILNSSPGYWTRRNSTAQSINFRTSSSDAQAWIRPRSAADDVAVPLAGRPYVPGSGTVLYTMFKAQWIDVGDIPAVGNSSGAFILLANNATATANQMMRVATTTNGLPEGSFRLRLSNGTDTYTEYTHMDLGLWAVYDIVVRYDVDTATSTLWINGVSEASPGVSATDNQQIINVSHLAIRQEPDMGNIYLDDLKVIAMKKPNILSLTPAGANVEFRFAGNPGDAASDFEVERATNATGPFALVTATIVADGENAFKATAPGAGNQSFYRVKRKPLTF
jgi:hypothetical protein